MPASSLLALIDDIATVLDDVALLTKVATKKTAGVLGDDLALNAEQVAGVRAERELPVVWGVAKGSIVNKAILVPSALAISALAPWAIAPLLMLGGSFLCFEGVEKLAHKFLHDPEEDKAHEEELARTLSDPAADLVALEQKKIKGAVRTDFVLSAEIVTIALGTVASEPLATQAAVLVGISLVMTAGVYGLVAGIVKLDDFGLHLSRTSDEPHGLQRTIGEGILKAAPYLMRGLSLAGTAAMFLVGGGILSHGLPLLHLFVEHSAATVGGIAVLGPILAPLVPWVINAAVGVFAGTAIVFCVSAVKRGLRRAPSPERDDDSP